MKKKTVEWKCKHCGCSLNKVTVSDTKFNASVLLFMEKLRCMMCSTLHWVKVFSTGAIRTVLIHEKPAAKKKEQPKRSAPF